MLYYNCIAQLYNPIRKESENQMSANAQKEVSKNQIGQWLKQTLVGQILGEALKAFASMSKFEEEDTPQEAIAYDTKKRPMERAVNEKTQKAIDLQQESEEKLIGRVFDTTHTFDNDVPEKDFHHRVKVETQEKQSKQETQKSVHKQVKADSDYQKEIGN